MKLLNKWQRLHTINIPFIETKSRFTRAAKASAWAKKSIRLASTGLFTVKCFKTFRFHMDYYEYKETADIHRMQLPIQVPIVLQHAGQHNNQKSTPLKKEPFLNYLKHGNEEIRFASFEVKTDLEEYAWSRTKTKTLFTPSSKRVTAPASYQIWLLFWLRAMISKRDGTEESLRELNKNCRGVG